MVMQERQSKKINQSASYARPPHGPRILRASCMSLVMIVTRLA